MAGLGILTLFFINYLYPCEVSTSRGIDVNLYKIALISILTLSLIPISAESLKLSDPENISENYGTIPNSGADFIVDEHGNIHAIWVDWQSRDFHYRKKTSDHWGDDNILDLSWSSYNYFHDIDYEDGKLHMVWGGNGTGWQMNIYYICFNGEYWEEPFEISTDDQTKFQNTPQIQVQDSKIYVVWWEVGNPNNNIHFRMNDGSSWQEEKILSNLNDTNKQDPNIISYDNKLYVFWKESEWDGTEWHTNIIYRDLNGIIWGNEKTVPVGNDEFTPKDLAVCSDDSSLNICWSEISPGDEKWDVYYIEMIDNAWSQVELVSYGNAGYDNTNPTMSKNMDTLHFFWVRIQDDERTAIYRYRKNDQWSDFIDVGSDITGESQIATKVISQGHETHFSMVVFFPDRDDEDVYFRTLTDYSIPTVHSFEISGSWDDMHIVDHSPVFNWTYFDEEFSTQVGYNITIRNGNNSYGHIIAFNNKTSSINNWQYAGPELIDGKYYYADIQVFNGYEWSSRISTRFKMNSIPEFPSNPYESINEIDIGGEVSADLSWEVNEDPDGDLIEFKVYGDFELLSPNSELTVINNSTKTQNIPHDGIYYWKICMTDGYEWSNGSIWSVKINTNDAPMLSGSGPIIEIDYPLNPCIFIVEYSDPENDIAINVSVIIDNTSYNMMDFDVTDTNTMDGKLYTVNVNLGFGNHRYYFRCSDEHGEIYETDSHEIMIEIPNTGINEITLDEYPSSLYVGSSIIFRLNNTGNDDNFTFSWKFSDKTEVFSSREVERIFMTEGLISFNIIVKDDFGRNITINGEVNIIEKADNKEENYGWIILAIIIPIIILIPGMIVLFFLLKRRRNSEVIETSDSNPNPIDNENYILESTMNEIENDV